MSDVINLVHLLAYRLPDGHTVLAALLDRASRSTICVEATGAPYAKRTILKSRGYHWDPSLKVWWIEVAEDGVDGEILWLGREVTPHGPPPRTSRITWRERHR